MIFEVREALPHSPTLTLLHLRHSSFFNPSFPHLRHSSFYNLSVASLTSQALHLRHLASRPCYFVTLPSVVIVSLNAQKEFYNITIHCGTGSYCFLTYVNPNERLKGSYIHFFAPCTSPLVRRVASSDF